jgi:hypothetical protein
VVAGSGRSGKLIRRHGQLNQIVVEVVYQPNTGKSNQPGKYDARQRAYKNDK